ncbi:unnamed protein product, partial [Closterium sp. Naga37s-1]
RRGVSPAVPVYCSANSHTGPSTSAPNTSAPSTSASAMTPDSGEATSFRQMSPEEHWWWGTPDYLMGNWHGQWRSWKPMQSTDEIRSMKSVRKFWATSPDLTSFAHMNDWYDRQGDVSPQATNVGVQWDMSLAQHSLPDGFCHVASSNARRYTVSRKADGIWAALEVSDGAGGIKLPFLVEFFFSHTPTSRLGTMVGFESDGAFRVSVVVEESLDTNERRPADWVWPTWGPGGVPSHLPDHLPPVPALDDKTMIGTRTILTRNLMVQERENVSWAEAWSPNSAAAAVIAAIAAAAGGGGNNGEAASAGGGGNNGEAASAGGGGNNGEAASAGGGGNNGEAASAGGGGNNGEAASAGGGGNNGEAASAGGGGNNGEAASAGGAAPEATAAAAAAGFMGRVPEGDEERYAVFALPHGVMVCAPRSLQLVAGRPFVLSVSWVVGEVGEGVVGAGEVKRITASWGADGGFERVEGEWYRREA